MNFLIDFKYRECLGNVNTSANWENRFCNRRTSVMWTRLWVTEVTDELISELEFIIPSNNRKGILKMLSLEISCPVSEHRNHYNSNAFCCLSYNGKVRRPAEICFMTQNLGETLPSKVLVNLFWDQVPVLCCWAEDTVSKKRIRRQACKIWISGLNKS